MTTPVQIACRKQHFEILEELLLHTNVNQVSVYGYVYIDTCG